MSVSGSLISFMEGKSFGFIKRDDGQGDVFVHVRQLRNGGEPDMVVGAKFTFDVEPDEKSGKTKAVNVTLTAPGVGGGGGGGFGGAPMPMGGGGANAGREKCGDFLAGRCTRGDRCKYSHDDGRGFGAVGGAQPDPRYSPYGAAPAYGAPMMGGAPGLQPGWEMITDPASGRPYYCNRATGQSSWEPPYAAPPMAPMPPAAPGLPAGWEQVTDPASGKPYYCNRATGQSSWEVPR